MEFKDCILEAHPTGSRYICDPPVLDTDNDTVILVNGYHPYHQCLRDEGWEACNKDAYKSEDFGAWRKGEDNYIVTEDPLFYASYVLATETAKRLNVINKDDRIALFIAMQESMWVIAGAGLVD